MKTTILTLCSILLMSAANASPFAVAQVTSSAVDSCNVALPQGTTPVSVAVTVDAVRGLPANGNRVCLTDVGSVAVGDTTMTFQAVSSLWGVLGSPVPFTFTRPAAGLGGIGLSQ